MMGSSGRRTRPVRLALLSSVALMLAAVGLYGLISYSVTQRTREIGIRMALGAGPSQVLTPMLREGLVLAAIGTGIGLLGALAGGRDCRGVSSAGARWNAVGRGFRGARV